MLFSDKSFVMLFIWRSAFRLWKHHCSQIVEMEISKTFARFTAALAILPLLDFLRRFLTGKKDINCLPMTTHTYFLSPFAAVSVTEKPEKSGLPEKSWIFNDFEINQKKRKSNGFKRFSQMSSLRKDKVNEIRVNASGTRRNVPERCLQFYGRHEMFLLSHAAETITSRR